MMPRFGKALVLAAVPAVVAGCEWPFPEMQPVDADNDGWTVQEGDCNDADTDYRPDVDECELILDEPADHDCDGITDGGRLDWVEEFDDGLLTGWTTSSSTNPAVLHEHDGVLEQKAALGMTIERAIDSECWQDQEVWIQAQPGLVGEFNCMFVLRARSVGGYQFRLHHHEANIDGFNGSHWDGYNPPSLSPS